MRILVSESADKQTRTYINVEPDELLRIIEADYGLHEVIDMHDPDVTVRLFFDVDSEMEDAKRVLAETLYVLNGYYRTANEDWAITDGSRPGMVSYHIYSKKYATSLRNLRRDVEHLTCPHIDDAVYSFSLFSAKDEGSMRLPNQSKTSINKEGGIHRLIQGDLRDCLVTQTAGLEQI